MGILANENAISSGGYQISNSLRFQSASSQYLSRTFTTPTNQKIGTYSYWFKRGDLSATYVVMLGSRNVSTGNGPYLAFENSSIRFVDSDGSAGTGSLVTTPVYRDPSAWYHVVMAIDTTQATDTNRFKLYINGTQVTAFGTASYPSLNRNMNLFASGTQYIGYSTGANFCDGYMTEINFIDGQALTPSSFGETNTLTGQWVAKKYTGTYGTNGFYLPFSNGTSTTTLGADSSGNGNNWTLTNFTRSAGVSDCWMYDVPSGNGGASATQPSSNYAVLNPLWKGANITISAANLNFSSTGASSNTVQSTVLMSSGKWYCEWTQTNAGGQIVGIASDANTPSLSYPGQNTTSYGYSTSGNKYNNGATSYGATWTTNDVIGIAFDADAGTLTFYKNGVSQGTAFTGIPAGNYGFCFGNNPAATITGVINFGQRSFAQSVPSGYKALCTANLPASTIVKGNQYMDATTYTGTGANGRQVTNQGGFEPGMIWIKNRSSAVSHIWQDTTRGVGASNALRSDTTGAESGQFVDAVNSTGYVVNGDTAVNGSGSSYVGWQWRTSSSTVTNTNGTISSQVRANPTAGVSVVTWTGTGANATIGHGLGVAPSMIIVKYRNSTGNWQVYHSALGNTRFVQLNTTIASTVESTMWNNTSPTSSVFTTGTNFGSLNIVAYCFAEIAGFSKFGSYTGNGSADGTFVYTGFRPRWLMVKCSSNTGQEWVLIDTARNTYNSADNYLYANSSAIEGSVSAYFDILSNGFKPRALYTTSNANGYTYIYMAFAENPFAQANAR